MFKIQVQLLFISILGQTRTCTTHKKAVQKVNEEEQSLIEKLHIFLLMIWKPETARVFNPCGFFKYFLFGFCVFFFIFWLMGIWVLELSFSFGWSFEI